MPLIHIENLADFIEQTTRQIQEGCANLRADGIIVVSPDEIQINCEVVRDVNAIGSTTSQAQPEKVTVATVAPSTETSVQSKGASRSETNFTAAENQTVSGESGVDSSTTEYTHKEYL